MKMYVLFLILFTSTFVFGASGTIDLGVGGGSGGGSGTVTSVGLSDGSTSPIFTITNSPVTSSGTLTETLSTQSANKVFAGPASGSAAQPTFRSLVAADIPDMPVPNPTPSPTQFAAWDANNNLSANSFLPSLTSTLTSGGTTTLTVASSQIQRFTGGSGQTVVLPSGSTLANGQRFILLDEETGGGGLTVKSEDGTTLITTNGFLGYPQLVVLTVQDNSGPGDGPNTWNWTLSPLDNTTQYLTSLAGTMGGNIAPASPGAASIGNSGEPLLGTYSKNFYLYDSYSDEIGSITETPGGAGVGDGLMISANYTNGPGSYGPLVLTTANNSGGNSGSLIFTPGTASTGVQGGILLGGHIASAAITTSPSISTESCASGTPTVTGTDSAFNITSATTCTSITVTFGQAFGATPICVATAEGTGITLGETTSTSALAVTGTIGSSQVIHVICLGANSI